MQRGRGLRAVFSAGFSGRGNKVNVAEEPNLIGYWPLEKPNADDSSLLVNEAVAGGEEGYILAGWSKVEALNLADPAPPIGTVFIFR